MSRLKQVVFSVPTDDQGMHHLSITKFLQGAELACNARGTDFVWNIIPAEPNTSTRNLQVNGFVWDYPEAGAQCFCDSDAIPDVEGFLLLLDAIERDDVDICYGWSLIHNDGDLRPNVTGAENADRGGARKTDVITPHAAPGLYEITGGACGAHCMIVKRRVFEAMFAQNILPFEDVFYRDKESEIQEVRDDWRNKHGTRKRGHDFLLSQRAADLGFRVWLDNRVYWGHYKTVDLRKWYGQVHALSVNVRAQRYAIDLLRELWGNEEWTASTDFLMRAAAEASRIPHDRVILELGSGLSTAVLSRCHPNVVALEAGEAEAEHAREMAPNANVMHAPLERFDGFDWYGVDAVREALSGKPVGLLIVDGPAGSTRGGRIGCVSQLRDKLAPGAVVMFDDLNREQDRDVVLAWGDGLDLDANITTGEGGRSFAVVRMPGG